MHVPQKKKEFVNFHFSIFLKKTVQIFDLTQITSFMNPSSLNSGFKSHSIFFVGSLHNYYN